MTSPTPEFWNANLLNDQGKAPEWTADYDLWVRDIDSIGQPRLPTGWSAWTFWDYALYAPVKCDLLSISDLTSYYRSRFNGTLAQLEDYAEKPNTKLALQDNFTNIWDLASGQGLRKISMFPAYVTSLAGSQDGSFLVSGHDSGRLNAWNLVSLLASGRSSDTAGGPDHNIGDQGSEVKALLLSPDNLWLVSLDSKNLGWLWNVPSQNYIAIPLFCQGEKTIAFPTFDPSGRWLAASHDRRAAVDGGARRAQAMTPVDAGVGSSANLRPLLALLQLASPALPVGGFAYSQGLESAISDGLVHDAASAQRWIGDALRLALARFEAPVWLRIHAAALALDEAALRHWNDEPLATRETAELRAESLQMGASMVRVYAPLNPDRSAVTERDIHRRLRHRLRTARHRALGRARRLPVGVDREPGAGLIKKLK